MTVPLEEQVTGTASLEHILDHVEASRVVDAMLNDLTDDEREAILLRYADGLSVREASVLMNRSEKGVESLLTRAKTKARGTMEQWLAGGER
jgi:RNA polymerase sigma factor (sigma-70 family)